jgi:CBS domain containing-hemolysin-like protein
VSALTAVLGLLAVVALTFGTAVAVAAEFSLTALERSQLDAHVGSVGDVRARIVQRAHRALSFQLSACQLAITITTLVTGYIAEPAIAELFRPGLEALGMSPGLAAPTATTLALLLATALSMVFGELVPKNLAIARPLETARAAAPIIVGFAAIFRWLIGALNSAANRIVRRLGIEPAEELRSARSPQELSSLVQSSALGGTLDSGVATILDRSLRFTERVAEDFMVPRVQVVAPPAGATVEDLIETSRRTGFSRFPVYGSDLDDIRGLVHVKQAFQVPIEQRSRTKLGDLARRVPIVPGSLDGDALLTELRASGLQTAIVVDEYGGTAGLVTLEDLVEEIVGDVRDEHDESEPPDVRKLDDGCWLVSGLLRDDEVAESTGFVMPPGEYETIAGLVLARLGRIPRPGDTTTVDDWQLTVEEMDRHRIASLRLRRPAADEEEAADGR